MNYSSLGTIVTVARREIEVALRSKGIIITLALTLVLAVGAVIAASIFLNDEEQPATTIAAVGDTTALSAVDPARITFEAVDSREAAVTLVEEGTAEGAVVQTDTGYTYLHEGQLPDVDILGQLNSALEIHNTNTTLGNLGVSAEDFAAAQATTTIDAAPLDGEAGIGVEALITTMIGVGLMAFFIMLFAGMIGGRVTEEKSSRVVEIILASVRPRDFLAGKLLGNGLFGLGMTVLVLGSACIALFATGLNEQVNLDLSVVPLIVISFIIGFFFFGALYSAAGSMVSRTEDLQSTQTPVMLLAIGMIYAPTFGVNALDSTVMQVFAWLPPFSLSVAPLQYVAGNFSLVQVVLAYVLAVVALVGTLLLVGRIYRNSIVHNGSKLTWLKAIKG